MNKHYEISEVRGKKAEEAFGFLSSGSMSIISAGMPQKLVERIMKTQVPYISDRRGKAVVDKELIDTLTVFKSNKPVHSIKVTQL